MDQINKALETLVEAAKGLDDGQLADFLVSLRAVERTLQAVQRERMDWRQFREALNAGKPNEGG